MSEPPLPAQVVDCRAHHRPEEQSPRYKRRPRPWSAVKGITLHQTACVIGERPARWYSVGCHAGVTRGGKIILLSDPTWEVVHGHAFNTHDVGLEIDGRYPGLEDDPRTLWPRGSKGTPLTPEAVQAVRDLLRYWCGLVAAHGGRIRWLHAHRQASAMRRSDPGEAIWRDIALPAMEELGLSSGPVGWATGDGYAIPAAWDERCKGVAY